MKIYKSNNILRATRKTKIWTCGICCVFCIAGILLYPLWRSFAVFTLFAIVISPIALQQLSAKIILDEDCIRVKSLFNRKVIKKETIDSVTWEKGGRVYIVLKNGKRIGIPELGNSLSVCNCVRAWMKNA